MKPLYAFAVVATLSACATQPVEQQSSTARSGTCKFTTSQEIAALFDHWNQSLATGDPKKVVANYANPSILLATLSNKPRFTPEEKEEYFQHFMANGPSGRIDMRHIETGCNTAIDAGLYTFTFAKTGQKVSARYSFTYYWDGKAWLITSHHSSMMPEKSAKQAKKH